ncbi:MAG: MerR family transcriptional regulator [Flavobacteriales bacterium AspAUS03]
MKNLVTKSKAAKIIGVTESTLKFYRLRVRLHPVATSDHRVYFHHRNVEDCKRSRQGELKKRQEKTCLEQ